MPLITREGTERPTGVFACAPPPAGDVVARLDRLDQSRNVLRLVLKVAVHRHDDVATRTRQPGVHRGMLAEVALEAHGANARVAGVQTLERRERAVRRAVVDEDQLERARARIEHRHRSPIELLEGPCFVVDGHDHRHIGRRQIRMGDSGALERLGIGHRDRG